MISLVLLIDGFHDAPLYPFIEGLLFIQDLACEFDEGRPLSTHPLVRQMTGSRAEELRHFFRC